MIRRFNRTEGKVLEKIPGQARLAFAMSGTEDFYDLIAWSERGGYQGSIILFYDFDNGEVYQPFGKKRNVVYGNPVFSDGFYYFLQGDYDENRITLYKYLPWEREKEKGREKDIETDEMTGGGQILEPVMCFKADDVNLYNLRIIGDKIHVISQDEIFRCYYPEQFSFALDPHETVCFIEEGKVYIEAWVEEGWDDENECATDEYRYYDKVIIKDFDGRLLSEETGSLFQASDGMWWIS